MGSIGPLKSQIRTPAPSVHYAGMVTWLHASITLGKACLVSIQASLHCLVLTAPSWTSLTKHTVPMRTLPGSWLEVDTV
jgi:hypothetical protein